MLFADNFKTTGLSTKEEIEAEYELLVKIKQELQIDYAEKQQKYKDELFTYV